MPVTLPGPENVAEKRTGVAGEMTGSKEHGTHQLIFRSIHTWK